MTVACMHSGLLLSTGINPGLPVSIKRELSIRLETKQLVPVLRIIDLTVIIGRSTVKLEMRLSRSAQTRGKNQAQSLSNFIRQTATLTPASMFRSSNPL